jgi:hypothetical protein
VFSNFTPKDYGASEVMYHMFRAQDNHAMPVTLILVILLVFTSIVAIIASAGASITVLAPSGDEIWQRGRSKTIEWSSSGTVGSSVDIDLYKGGVLERNIIPGTSNDGTYSWSLPTDLEPDVDYSIRITSSSDNTIFDYSDTYFTIGLDRLEFSGYTWRVRDTQGSPSGPGPNIFSSSPENVWLDSEGQLHLKITNRNGQWYCGEVYSDESFGYGLYTFFTGSRADTIDKNSILGLFTYLDDDNEIDIEFARWGWEAGTNLDYVCQPGQTAGNAHSFNVVLPDNYSTHSFNWQGSEINYQSLYGHYYEPPSQGQVIQTWDYTGPDIPPESTERTHMNLWLMSGLPPSDGQEIEVVISEFNFTKLPDPPTLSPKPTLSSPLNASTFMTGDTVTFDWPDVAPSAGNIHYLLEWTQDPYDTDSLGHYNSGGSWSGDVSQHSEIINTPGSWYYHVYAFDDAGEYTQWSDDPGPWDDNYIEISDNTAPPTNLQAALVPLVSHTDVELSWDASSDDGAGENDVTEYIVYRSTKATGPFTNITSVSADGSPSYSYLDIGAGDGDVSNYFYKVHAVDAVGNEVQNSNQVAKWVTYLDEDWNVFSLPLLQASSDRADVLATIEDNYYELQGYIAGEPDPWKHWHHQKPSELNDLTDILSGNGYYINMKSEDQLVTVGSVQTSMDIDLKAGWNLIGNPMPVSKTFSYSDLPSEIDFIKYYNVSASENRFKFYDPVAISGELKRFDMGHAYWFHSGADTSWNWSTDIYEQPDSLNWEEIGPWWDELVEIGVGKWGIEDPYFIASLVKKESWFNASAYNAAEKASYENGDDNWFEEYYGKGLLQITGSWIAGVPQPNASDWIFNMPLTAIHGEAPELLDAYSGEQNLNRGCWYIKSLLEYYDYDQYKVATAYRYGWQSLDAGDHDPYDNGYILDVFTYKQEYLENVGLSEADFPNIM